MLLLTGNVESIGYHAALFNMISCSDKTSFCERQTERWKKTRTDIYDASIQSHEKVNIRSLLSPIQPILTGLLSKELFK